LAIAIQQATLVDRLQQELTQRQAAQAQLTERNQQLALNNEELARATRLKDEFLANMSHELRTPLNAILGIVEGLQENVFGSVSEQQIKVLQIIERSGNHLLSLINDILDLAKIEAGRVELAYNDVEIHPLCESSLAFVKQQALEKRIRLSTKLPRDFPPIRIDERRVRQVLINLLNNAVKFTSEGGSILLEVGYSNLEGAIAQPDPDSQTLYEALRFSVTDTGIGISEENLKRLFQPFIQVDSALNRQYEGTGLGLALVKRIVNLHGGMVNVTSTLGQGSCFSFTLPLTQAVSASAVSGQGAEVTETTSLLEGPESAPLILLVEDNEANIVTVSSYLDTKGYRLLVARDGAAAVTLATLEHPDLIVMDIQMPGVDGIEAMRQIRKDEGLANVPIIALTALTMPGDQERCLQAGANDYLSKPMRLKHLMELIQKWLLNR
jgi:signal transduction histidine kinase